MDATPSSPLTNAQLLRLSGGLAALDGLQLKPGEFEVFKLNAETTFKIAANSAIVAEKVAAFERAKKLLTAKYQIAEGMQVTATNAQNVSDFMDALALLEEKTVEVAGLETIKRADLNVGSDKKLGQNQIPASALAKLWPILEA